MRIFKTRWFARFSRAEKIDDQSLAASIERVARGLVDADLGGGLIKQRVARKGQGRSSGYRVILAYRIRDRAVFLYGFAKNERENIAPDELEDLRVVAQGWLEATARTLEVSLKDGAILEVMHGNESN